MQEPATPYVDTENANEPMKSSQVTLGLFLIYLTVLVWIIVFKFGIEMTYTEQRDEFNLIPYQRPLVLNGQVSYAEILLNVLIFFPFGLYIGALFGKWSFGRSLALFSLVSLVLEISQYLLKIGALDITDLINNSLGGYLGLLAFRGVKRLTGSQMPARRWVNSFAGIGTIAVLTLILYLKVNRLYMFRM